MASPMALVLIAVCRLSPRSVPLRGTCAPCGGTRAAARHGAGRQATEQPKGGPARGLYEPVHGTAPDIAGRGVANPLGAILSAALLLRHSCGLAAEAAAVERAVTAALDDGLRTADLMSVQPSAVGRQLAVGTSTIGDAIVARLAAA